MKYAIKHRAIKKYRKNKSANINCIVLSFAAFSICDFLSVWFEADPNQYNYTISEPVCQFINCITVMFFGTAKCRANSRWLWSGEGRKVMPLLCQPYNKPPKTVMWNGFGGDYYYSHSIRIAVILVSSCDIMRFICTGSHILSAFFVLFIFLRSKCGQKWLIQID